MTMSSSVDNGGSNRWTQDMASVTFVPMQADPLFEHHLRDRLERLSAIGVALSAERDLGTLLERIVLEARRFTSADAGTLYLLQGDLLHFEIAHNDTLGLRQGGQGETLDVPPVPLDKNSASGYVAVTGEVLNIADVYDDPDFDFEGPKQYDRLTGYLTQSMLVLPMTDHEGRVIGVLQLINAIGDGEIIPFSLEEEVLIRSLASQAAVAINNVRLIDETRRLYSQVVQSERMASVGIVAAGIVHNLKNYLTSIQGFAELLEHNHPDITGVKEIVIASGKMDQMIADILAKSRQRKTAEAVDLNTLLRREIDFLLADAVFKYEVEKDISLAEDLPPIECVYTDFSQAIGNLLHNALHAMHDRDPKKLTVTAARQAEHIVVAISDTGCGIAPKDIEQLFEPFFTTKLDTGENDEPVGTGLGLYMVKRLLEPYKVKIKVESVVVEGTTFRLEIPLEV